MSTPQDAPLDAATAQGLLDSFQQIRDLLAALRSPEVQTWIKEVNETLAALRELVQALQSKDLLQIGQELPEMFAELKELLAAIKPVLDLLRGGQAQGLAAEDITAAAINLPLLLKLLAKAGPVLQLLLTLLA